jgi:SAM-dependent methyltransferase
MTTTNIYTNPEGEYIQNNPTWHIEDSPWKAQQILKMLKQNELLPKTITEIGCGVGEILLQLQQQLPTGIKFTGYEVSPDAYKLSQSRKNEYLQFKFENLLEQEQYSDLLLVIDVFEHVDDYMGFITKCKSKARYKLFHIPLDISMVALLRGTIMEGRKKVGHLHYFTKDTALATLKDCGLNIIDSFYTPGGIQLSRTLKSKLAKFPRLLMYKLNKDLAVTLMGGHSLMVLTE